MAWIMIYLKDNSLVKKKPSQVGGNINALVSNIKETGIKRRKVLADCTEKLQLLMQERDEWQDKRNDFEVKK